MMKPFPHDLNLGYSLCKCKQCKKAKAKRVNHNTAMRMKANAEIRNEIQNTTQSNDQEGAK